MKGCYESQLLKTATALMLAIVLFTPISPSALAEGQAAKNETSGEKPKSITVDRPNDYCANIAIPARDARYQLQKKILTDLQKRIDEQLILLQDLHQKNIKFEAEQTEKAKSVQKAVTDIYSKMKPDVAAAQLELLDPEMAVAILNQLNVRAASSILNEMKGNSAAVITALMAAPAKVVQP